MIIRGFADTASDNTLILINGQKLTNIDMSLVDLVNYSNGQYPKNRNNQREIVPVLYGGNATAGDYKYYY